MNNEQADMHIPYPQPIINQPDLKINARERISVSSSSESESETIKNNQINPMANINQWKVASPDPKDIIIEENYVDNIKFAESDKKNSDSNQDDKKIAAIMILKVNNAL